MFGRQKSYAWEQFLLNLFKALITLECILFTTQIKKLQFQYSIKSNLRLRRFVSKIVLTLPKARGSSGSTADTWHKKRRFWCQKTYQFIADGLSNYRPVTL